MRLNPAHRSIIGGILSIAIGPFVAAALPACGDTNDATSGGGGGGGGGDGGSGGGGSEPAPPPKASPKAVCKQWMACVTEVDVNTASEFLDQYGDSGTCWTKSETDQATCGAFCGEKLPKWHATYPNVVACASCSEDAGCLDPEARRCWNAGQADARCSACAVDAHCTDPAAACYKDGCYPKECADRTLAKQLHAFRCSATCDPIFCDEDPDSEHFGEAYAWKLGCHDEYAELVNCQLSSGKEGCSPLGACNALYETLNQCEDAAEAKNVKVCPNAI